MNLAFFLKIFADLCFYGTFAAYFASMYGLAGSVLPQFALLALAAALSRMADRRQPNKPLRFVPLVLCPAVFFLPTQVAGLIILVPAALYVAVCCAARRTQPDYFNATDLFFLELKLLILPAVMAVALAQLQRAEQFALPYLLVFLLCSVLLLRMLRHDEATLSQTRFRVMNGVTAAVLCLVCAILGSPQFRALLAAAFKAVWRVVSVPIFVGLGAIGMVFAWILMTVLPDELNYEGVLREPMQVPEELEELQKEMMAEQATDPSRVVVMVISGILIVLAVIAAVLLFRRLMASRRRDEAPGGEQRRFSAAAAPPPQRPLTRLGAKTPDLQVRYWYQQLLHRTRQEGGTLSADMDSRQQNGVEQDIFSHHQPEVRRLRQLYLPARYKGEATAEDAKEAKTLFQRIKKS